MKRTKTILLALLSFAVATPSFANCFVDYKAKRGESGLELHYGVMQMSAACDDQKSIRNEVQARIAGDGWQLLRVMSSFGQNQLKDKQADAGEYFLRY